MKQVLVSKKLRNSARGQDCSLQIVGVCNHRTDTTVLAHFPSEIAGSKSTDLSSGYACSDCHDVIDGRVKTDVSDADLEFYMRRATVRTQTTMWLSGLIVIK